MLIVADTSPLNYLVLIDSVHVLPRLYGRVMVPPQVWTELAADEAPEAVKAWISRQPDGLEVRTPTRVDMTPGLHPGEAAAIALAQELRADRLLIDDRDGREVATRLGVPVAGTLAVLRDAAGAGALDLRAAFDRLRATTFRASPRLIDQVLREFEERKGK
jgi:predicted nucleic acid-binding protein